MIIQNVLALFFGKTAANLKKVKISQTFLLTLIGLNGLFPWQGRS